MLYREGLVSSRVKLFVTGTTDKHRDTYTREAYSPAANLRYPLMGRRRASGPLIKVDASPRATPNPPRIIAGEFTALSRYLDWRCPKRVCVYVCVRQQESGNGHG